MNSNSTNPGLTGAGNIAVKLHEITRVQLSRRPGSHLPPFTLVVDRRSPFGNWVRIDRHIDQSYWSSINFAFHVPTKAQAVSEFERWLVHSWQKSLRLQFLTTIRERSIRHLACWCPLEEVCHVDVWLNYLQGKYPALLEELV